MAHENGQLDKVSKYNKILFVAGGVLTCMGESTRGSSLKTSF